MSRCLGAIVLGALVFCCNRVAARGTQENLRIESHVPSIHVTIERSRDGKHTWIAYTNESARAVTKYCLSTFENRCRATNGPIEPGEKILGAAVGPVLVVAAIFRDGTYEGDGTAASVMAADYVGTQAEFERMELIVGEILDEEQPDTRSAERIRAALRSLQVPSDARLMERLHNEFPSIPSTSDRLSDHILAARISVVKSTLQGLDIFERHEGPPKTLAEWWAIEKRAFHFTLNRPVP